MTFRQEIRHEGLRRSRIIQGPDPHAVQRQVRDQREAWSALWESGSTLVVDPSRDGWPTEREGPPASPEEGHRIAASLTEQAQESLKALGTIFPGELQTDRPFPADTESFSEPPPEEPHLPYPEPKPVRTGDRFQPRLGLLDRVSPSRRKLREKQASERFQAAWAKWYEQEKEVQETLSAYQVELEEWNRRRLDFEAAQRRLKRKRQASGEGDGASGPSTAVEHYSAVLSSIPFPACLPKEADLSFDSGSGILAVEYRLPAPEDIPTLAGFTFREDSGDFLEEHLSETDHRALYDSVVFQCVLRAIQEIFRSANGRHLRAVTFNGWADVLDPATGRKKKVYLAIMEAGRDHFVQIAPDRVSPEACFRVLGGLCNGQPHHLLGTPPVGKAEIEDADPSETTPESVDPDQIDLWAQSLGDFQRLMVRILEEEFIPEGWSHRVTVARDDGSLEAIAESPVSGRAESIIFHVERSTAPLGEGTVQDLLDRMAFEKVHRGVLLTTSTLKPGAEALASGKPIALFDGADLARLAGKVFPPDQSESERSMDDQEYAGSSPH